MGAPQREMERYYGRSTGLIVLCGPMGRDFRIAMLLTVLLRVNLNWQPAIHQPFT
jgi:hypothetical protein